MQEANTGTGSLLCWNTTLDFVAWTAFGALGDRRLDSSFYWMDGFVLVPVLDVSFCVLLTGYARMIT